MVTINFGELLTTAFINAIPLIWAFWKPFVYDAIAASIIVFALCKIAYPLFILGGSSPREAKKNVNRFKDLLGFFSSLGDIYKK